MDSQNMASRFQISDLDDFLAPAQDWVVQLMTPKPSQNTESKNQGAIQIELETDFDNEGSLTGGVRPDLIKKGKDNIATISLSDCLACNGWVTTAETMLIQQHSIDKFEELLSKSGEAPVIVSISQQSLCSLSLMYNTEPEKMFQVINTVLITLGVVKVYDLSLAQQLALNESYKEFFNKYTQSEKYELVKEFFSKVDGMTEEDIRKEAQDFKKHLAKVSSQPVLWSEWPGWVCYAEKVVGDLAIPYMSIIKSPQQIQGYFLKNVVNRDIFSDSMDLPDNIIHVCIMPCYDKKLEAVRPSLSPSLPKEVDAVLATHELVDLFVKHSISIPELLASLPVSSISNFYTDLTGLTSFNNSMFYSSGKAKQTSNGYTEFIFRKAAKEIFGVDLGQEAIEYKRL